MDKQSVCYNLATLILSILDDKARWMRTDDLQRFTLSQWPKELNELSDLDKELHYDSALSLLTSELGLIKIEHDGKTADLSEEGRIAIKSGSVLTYLEEQKKKEKDKQKYEKWANIATIIGTIVAIIGLIYTIQENNSFLNFVIPLILGFIAGFRFCKLLTKWKK